MPFTISHSEIATQADFSHIRYGQCWEDADILLKALDIQPGDVCLSIASAGDNTLAMLTQQPGRVIALDLNPTQLACLELRVAAYRALTHEELLCLIGSRQEAGPQTGIQQRRHQLYQRCRNQLSDSAQQFWDAHPAQIAQGIGQAGRFERYFHLFRRYLLPLVHNSDRVDRLLRGGPVEQRDMFYQQTWNSWRWRWLFRVFFSQTVMGRIGRDPSFFQYVEGPVAEQILTRTEYALTQLDPADNPYLQWILTGQHTTVLPYALRPEHFEMIRANLDRLEWHCCSIEDFLMPPKEHAIDRYNLSDIFEYLSPKDYHRLLQQLTRAGREGGRLVYWNMLVPRTRPIEMADQLRALTELAQQLHRQDKAFFYQRLVIEEIL